MRDQNGNAEDNVSLDPLTPEEALRALLAVEPDERQDDKRDAGTEPTSSEPSKKRR